MANRLIEAGEELNSVEILLVARIRTKAWNRSAVSERQIRNCQRTRVRSQIGRKAQRRRADSCAIRTGVRVIAAEAEANIQVRRGVECMHILCKTAPQHNCRCCAGKCIEEDV